MNEHNLEENEKAKYAACWDTGEYTQSEQSYWIFEFIKSLKPKGKVLDLGCGNGFVVKRLVENGIDAYGVDITSSGWMKKSKVNPAINVLSERLFEAPLWKTPFKDQEFDITFSTTVLEHVPMDMVPSTIQEIMRLTKEKTIHYVDVIKEQEQFGEDLHMTVQPPDWWLKEFEKFNQNGVQCIVEDKHNLTEATFQGRTAGWYLRKFVQCVKERRLPDFITDKFKNNKTSTKE